MTIRPSIDVATRVSAELSMLFAKHVADADRETPPTLGDVRERLLRRGGRDSRQTEFLHLTDRESVLVESITRPVADVIVREARKWKADLIVIGTHGRRGLRRVVMGSDAEQVVRSAPAPVLLIRAAAP